MSDLKMAQNNLLRVTQMNAVYLDKEIVKGLQEALLDAIKYLPPPFSANLDAELRLLVNIAVIYCSVVQSGSTFGQNLLSIRYDNISKTKRILYLLSGFLGYAKFKFEHFNPGHKINDLLFKIDGFYKVFHLLNVTWFLRDGAMPKVIERFLGLNQVYAHEGAQRKFDSKYLGRELLWNGFIEVLVYVLPLINYHKLRRKLRNANPFNKKVLVSAKTVRHMTLNTKCGYCNETPVLPHHMGCSHIFCYVCLKGNQMADEQFQCPLCDYSSANKLCEQVVM